MYSMCVLASNNNIFDQCISSRAFVRLHAIIKGLWEFTNWHRMWNTSWRTNSGGEGEEEMLRGRQFDLASLDYRVTGRESRQWGAVESKSEGLRKAVLCSTIVYVHDFKSWDIRVNRFVCINYVGIRYSLT